MWWGCKRARGGGRERGKGRGRERGKGRGREREYEYKYESLIVQATDPLKYGGRGRGLHKIVMQQ